MKKLTLSMLAALLLVPAHAHAACPPATAGNTAEEIKINELRVTCLQQELAMETNRQKLQLDIDGMERRLQNLELQQRLNSLPQVGGNWQLPRPAPVVPYQVP